MSKAQEVWMGRLGAVRRVYPSMDHAMAEFPGQEKDFFLFREVLPEENDGDDIEFVLRPDQPCDCCLTEHVGTMEIVEPFGMYSGKTRYYCKFCGASEISARQRSRADNRDLRVIAQCFNILLKELK